MIEEEIRPVTFQPMEMICFRTPISYSGGSSSGCGGKTIENTDFYRHGYVLVRGRNKRTGKPDAAIRYLRPNPHDISDRRQCFIPASDTETKDEIIAALARRGYRDVVIEHHWTWEDITP